MPTRIEFTQEQLDTMKEMYESGLSAGLIAEKFGVSAPTIHSRLHAMGVHIRRANEKPMCWLEGLKAAYESGMTLRQIGKEYGLNDVTVMHHLRKLDTEMRPRGRLPADVNEQFFDDLSEERPAYWLGFLMADGCVEQPSKGQNILSLACADHDAEIIKMFVGDIGYNGNVYVYGSVNHVKIASDALCGRLIDLGCTPRKSKSLQFPTAIPHVSVKHFLRGYIDGDGSLGIYQRTANYSMCVVQASCGSLDFLEEFKDVLMALLPDISDVKIAAVNGSYAGSSGAYLLRWGGYQCIDIAHLLYGDCSVALPRKLEIAQRMMEMG